MKSIDEIRRQALLMFSRCGGVEGQTAVPAILRAGGEEVGAARRDELLAKLRAGEHVEVEIDILAYEQMTGARNRNAIRFRDGAMLAFGRSGVGTPFLRDHDWDNLMARAGTVVASRTEKVADGHYRVFQTVKLTTPWAVEAALLGNMDRFSIGAHPTGDVLCSACNAPIFSKCYHLPNQRLRESDEGERGKRLVHDRSGDIVVEWIYTSAELVETSGVNVPAVPTAQIEGIRAALSVALSNSGPEPQENLMITKLATLATMLGLAATASEDEVIKAVGSMGQRLSLTEQQRDEVTSRAVAAEAKLASYEQVLAKNTEDKFIDDGVQAGKVIPGSQFETSLRAFYRSDAEGAKALLASSPAVTPVGKPRQSDQPAPALPGDQGTQARAKFAQAGVDYEQAKAFAKAFGSKNPDKSLARYVAGEEA